MSTLTTQELLISTAFKNTKEYKALKRINKKTDETQSLLERTRSVRRAWASHRGYHLGMTDDDMFARAGATIIANLLRKEFKLEHKLSDLYTKHSVAKIDAASIVLEMMTTAYTAGEFVLPYPPGWVDVWKSSGRKSMISFGGINNIIKKLLKTVYNFRKTIYNSLHVEAVRYFKHTAYPVESVFWIRFNSLMLQLFSTKLFTNPVEMI